MIEIKDVINIHNILIDRFGGVKGIRDSGSLDSAINRPFATFDGQDLYPTSIEKAAALFESVLINHPFIDGNKRLAYTLMSLMLLDVGLDIEASQDGKYKMVIAASTGQIRFEEIKTWIQARIRKTDGA